MRPSLLLVLVLLFSALFAPLARSDSPQPPQAAPVPRGYRPGAVLVSFKPGAEKAGRASLARTGLHVTQEIAGIRVVSVAVPFGEEEATARALAGRSDVAFAEPDYEVRAQAIPNDPNYGQQWGLSQIGAPGAWDVTTGSSDVTVAVVDSGIDLGHPDLAGKVWENPGELVFNGKDDDGNGYVDDTRGWHFYHAWNGATYEARGDNLIADDNGHGTHVSGIAAAASNNGIGVAGVSWASRVMIVKALSGQPVATGWDSDIAAGILYAVDNGASIINLSVGLPEASQALCNAVAVAAGRGKLVVAAAGNGSSTVFYPAMCPAALAVAATDRSDPHAGFSNSGPRVDLAAPGVDILSTWYATGTGEHKYRAMDGTSFAAPFVSGAAALVWSRWPALSAEGVKSQLIATAVDVGAPGKDDQTGWGRLDASAAVAAPSAPVDLSLTAAVAPPVVVAGNPLTATFTVTNSGAVSASSVTLHATLPAAPTLDAVQRGATSCRLDGVELTCGLTRLDGGAGVSVSVVITPTEVGTGQLATSASVSAAQRELTPEDNRRTVQSGIRPVLSGRVFLDTNGDGIRQAWEIRGVGNAYLYLEQDDQPIAFGVSQRPDGAYSFDTLALGAYLLRAELPPDQGLQLTTPQDIAVAIEPAQEEVVYFGAWNGVFEPTPTVTPSPTPQAGRFPTYLPVIVR